MSDRLEEIKKLTPYIRYVASDTTPESRLLVDSWDYLIHQAERMKELEKLNHFYANEVARGHLGELSNYELIEKENQRYKQALESILNYNQHELTVPNDVIEMIQKELRGDSQ